MKLNFKTATQAAVGVAVPVTIVVAVGIAVGVAVPVTIVAAVGVAKKIDNLIVNRKNKQDDEN
jgi:hypothetical protein